MKFPKPFNDRVRTDVDDDDIDDWDEGILGPKGNEDNENIS